MLQIRFGGRPNVILLSFLVAGSHVHAAERRPSILFFFADDSGRY